MEGQNKHQRGISNSEKEVSVEARRYPRTGAQNFFTRSDDKDVAITILASLDGGPEIVHASKEKQVLRKIDLIIMPCLILSYVFFYIDKTTLSYAALFGVIEDVHLHGTQYSWLSSLFYFGFLVWAFPANYLMQQLPIGKYLGVNICFWGALLMLQATTSSFASIGALRCLAGAAESCFDPAAMLITSMWYSRREQPFRIGFWYAGNGLGIALGGLIGYGIGHIHGSLPRWKYEFIIIGALCCAWGIAIALFFPDSLATAKAFSPEEKGIIVKRKEKDQTGIETKWFKPHQAAEAFFDIKSYLFFFFGVVATVPNGGISNFGTLIIKGFGFDTLATTLMQVPYGAVVIISIIAATLVNDRFTNKRCVLALIFLCPNIAGAFGLRYVTSGHQVGRYICYLLTAPYLATAVLVLSLVTANTAGHTKKVITNAMVFVGYSTGNIAGPFFYKTDQAPKYFLGFWSMIVSHLLEAAVILALWVLLSRENRQRDKSRGSGENGTSESDAKSTAFEDMTDAENPNFRYIY